MAFGDFTVTRASTKNVLGSAGLYVSVANNTPAFEFNTDGTYRGLLVEPGATNLVLYSQEFDNGAWTKLLSSITANGAVSPDGTTTGDKLVEDTSTGFHAVRRNSISLTSGTSYTYSVFAKASERTRFRLVSFNGTTDISTIFNLSLGTVVSGATGTIQDVGNGWYRCSHVFTATTTTSTNFAAQIHLDDGSTNSYLGDGTSGIFIWQAQLETGSVATSPIVTTGSTAARVADVISLTSASSLIGQTQGTIYMELDVRNFLPSSAIYAIALTDGTTNNIIGLRRVGTTGLLNFAIVQGGVFGASIPLSPISNGVVKIAGAYANNDAVFYVNGAQVGTDASVTIPSTSRIDLGGITGASQITDYIRAVALFPTRLANATLASITTL